MQLREHYFTADHGCAYLPDQTARLECEDFACINPTEYSERLLEGWRRFSSTVFRASCSTCRECLSLRVDAARFRPNRSQRRNLATNSGRIRLEIGEATMNVHAVHLLYRFHHHRSRTLGWPRQDDSAYRHFMTFVMNPFPTEEWRYYLDSELVGVGYVDALPVGLSAIYFGHEPSESHRGLGIWNVLQLIEQARERNLPHVYLGYMVSGCRSLSYKARFHPHEIYLPDRGWVPGPGSTDTDPVKELDTPAT